MKESSCFALIAAWLCMKDAAFCSACGRPVGSSLGEFQPVRVAYARFWLRLAAVLIDSFVVAIPSLVIVMRRSCDGTEAAGFGRACDPVSDTRRRVFWPMEASPGSAVAVFRGYGKFALARHLGKRALGIAVTDLNGKTHFLWACEQQIFRKTGFQRHISGRLSSWPALHRKGKRCTTSSRRR